MIYLNDIWSFIKSNPKIVTTLIIVALACFGFLLTSQMINPDELFDQEYYSQTILVSVGRMAMPLIQQVTGLYSYSYFFIDYLAVFMLIINALFYLSLLNKYSNFQISRFGLLVFGLMFISFPLINEYFIYNAVGFHCQLSYFLCLIVYELFEKNKTNKSKWLIVKIILISIFIISFYESFIFVLVFNYLVFKIIRMYYQNDEFIFKDFLKFISIIFIAIILELLLGQLIIILFNIQPNNYVSNKITWTRSNFNSLTSILISLIDLIRKICANYFFRALNYLPFFTFVLAIIIGLFVSVKIKLSCQKSSVYIIFLLLFLLNISLLIITNDSPQNRANMTLVLYCAFMFMMLIELVDYTFLNKMFKILVCFLILMQVKDLHMWFYMDYRNFSYDRNIINEVMNDIDNKNRPIVFVGEASINPVYSSYQSINNLALKQLLLNKKETNFKYYLNTNSNEYYSRYSLYLKTASIIGPDSYPEYPNTIIYKFIHQLDYKFIEASKAQQLEAYQLKAENKIQSKITYYHDYIIVDLSHY